MKTAVTGASGHVGNNLCRVLISRGFPVRALCHKDTRALEGLDLERVHGDLLDPGRLAECFQGVEVVFHAAAAIAIDRRGKGLLERINVEGTGRVIEACRRCGVRRLVHFSSIHALEQAPLGEALNETRSLVGPSGFAYDRSKAEAERSVLAAAAQGMDAVILNPTAVLGPHDHKPSLMGQALIDLCRGRVPGLVPGGFDWVDVRDVAMAAAEACTRGRSGERYLLSGNWASLAKLARSMAELAGSSPPRFTFPLWLARLSLPFIQAYSLLTGSRPLYTRESLAILAYSNRHIVHSKAREELGFQPRPLQDTLRDTHDWFKRAGMLS